MKIQENMKYSKSELIKLNSVFNITEEHSVSIKDKYKKQITPLPTSPTILPDVDSNDEKITDTTIDTILDNINASRFDEYTDWLSLYMVFVNDNLNKKLFESHSKKSIKYNKNKNEQILKGISPKQGLSIASLYYWLKQDNSDVFKKLVANNKYFFNDKIINNKDIANLYYNMNPNQFLYNKDFGWYTYNKYNVLDHCKDTPTALLNDISNRMHGWLEELKNSIKLDDKTYKNKMEMLHNAYKKLGSSTFIKGVIDFLKNLYSVDRIMDKLDSNKNIIAFDNCLYDLELGKFRSIRPNDYISMTTKYSINMNSNPIIRDKIENIIYSIFENLNVINFWKTSTALTLFGRSFESQYIHTGVGRNGKGILSTIIRVLLGDYFLAADNNFLNIKKNNSETNPVLAKGKGARYLMVSEPDNGSGESTLNIEFIKWITGGDPIIARKLYENNVEYVPFFTSNLLCNAKPKLSKIDVATEERLKIIHYPFTFVDNPTLPHERQKNNFLKDEITQLEFINEFMLMLLDVANANKHVRKLELPSEIVEQNKAYMDENNVVKDFIFCNYDTTDNDKDRIKSSELLTHYNMFNDEKIKADKLKQMMMYNGFKFKKLSDGNYYLQLKKKVVDNIKSDSDMESVFIEQPSTPIKYNTQIQQKDNEKNESESDDDDNSLSSPVEAAKRNYNKLDEFN
jgi:phage/plasmid-associated DNA primase